MSAWNHAPEAARFLLIPSLSASSRLHSHPMNYSPKPGSLSRLHGPAQHLSKSAGATVTSPSQVPPPNSPCTKMAPYQPLIWHCLESPPHLFMPRQQKPHSSASFLTRKHSPT